MTADLDRAIRVRRERRNRRDRERSFTQELALAGALGWTVVLPALAGVALGRWVDRLLGTGIAFTTALLFVGVVAGCAIAWRRMRP